MNKKYVLIKGNLYEKTGKGKEESAIMGFDLEEYYLLNARYDYLSQQGISIKLRNHVFDVYSPWGDKILKNCKKLVLDEENKVHLKLEDAKGIANLVLGLDRLKRVGKTLSSIRN